MSYETLLLQNLAAESDERTTAIDWQWWSAIRGDTALYQPYEWYEERWVKVRFDVCPLCDGRGRHVNPSIDAHGLTRDDFDEDPDFAEGYFRGDYDVRCNLCSGEKVVPVPLDAEIVAEITERAESLAEMRAEQLAEMRMGA